MYILKTTFITILVLCLFFTQSALAVDALRPMPLRLQVRSKDAEGVFSRKSSSTGTITYTGISNAVPVTVIGKAALFSSYSAYDILRNVRHENVNAERDVVLPRTIEELKQAIQNSGVENKEAACSALDNYQNKVRDYCSGHIASQPHKNRISEINYTFH